MKKLLPIILLSAAYSTGSNKTGEAQPAKDTVLQQASEPNKPAIKAEGKIQTLTLSYNAFSCTCAQWSESKFDKDPGRIHYWLEPKTTLLVNADTLYHGSLPVQIRVTGQVINEDGTIPPGINREKVGLDETAKIFMYTKIEVLKNGQKKTSH